MAPVPNLSVKEPSIRSLTPDNINPRLPLITFPLPNPVFERAIEIQNEINQGRKKPYPNVISAHPGDPQGLGQPPLTFFRQIMSLIVKPDIQDAVNYPEDVVQRANEIISCCMGKTIGAYTYSIGMEKIRRQVAKYLEKRDNVPSDYRNIFLSNGATGAIRDVLNLFNRTVNNKPAGVMVPVPLYPLYAATLTEYGMRQIDYVMDEEKNWQIHYSELKRSINESRRHCDPRAIVIISPGNPNGTVLTRETMEIIIKFAFEENLVILADEVYHNNVYGEGIKHYSFKKVMYEMGRPYCDMELASFISASKSYVGECGFRGGCCELVNFDPDVKMFLYKQISALLCPNSMGQVAMYCLANPPESDEPSYEKHIKEKLSIQHNIKIKSEIFVNALNQMPGISCKPVNAAFYVFPRIFIPEKAIAKARSKGQQPDDLYSMEMLEKSGVCSCPGHLFFEKPGTYHVRLVFAIPMDLLMDMVERLDTFQRWFMEEYK